MWGPLGGGPLLLGMRLEYEDPDDGGGGKAAMGALELPGVEDDPSDLAGGGGASTPSSAIKLKYSVSILAFSENVCIGPALSSICT